GQPENKEWHNMPLTPIIQNQLTADNFVFLSPAEHKLKAKIEQIGTPLKEWDIQINYGIKTGLNDAFIIDETTRQKILSGCLNEDEKQRTDAIIKPILRGRDIKRYTYEWAGLYLINFHNGYKTSVILSDSEKSLSNIQDSSLATQVQNDETVSGSLKEIEIFPLDINDYPALKKWLDNFEPALSKRTDKGKTPYNLRNCAYLEEFEKEKIVYPDITHSAQFHIDNQQTFVDCTGFLLTGENLHYLLGMLNSEITAILFKKFYAGGGLGSEGYRYKKAFLENLPIPQITPDQEQIFVALVEEIIALKKQNTPENQAKIDDLEQQINHKIYALYQLNTAEIQYLHTHPHTHPPLALLAIISRYSDCEKLLRLLLDNYQQALQQIFNNFSGSLKVPNPRIIWSDMATKASFVQINADETVYINNTCYMMTNFPKHCLGLLNSKLLQWYFFQIASSLGQGARFFKQFVELLPIPQITPQNETIIKHIVQSVEQIINNTDEIQKNTISQQIDQWVYKLYGLTDEEIKIVEQA
ncbi:MAG: hypothetical protein IKG79_04740, partial [Neisseriaceae bacterium]|nr:hypothetical protein [Neisseriaceae bacterium]